jgi:hypothetical protein
MFLLEPIMFYTHNLMIGYEENMCLGITKHV